jgi:hypothetical protein
MPFTRGGAQLSAMTASSGCFRASHKLRFKWKRVPARIRKLAASTRKKAQGGPFFRTRTEQACWSKIRSARSNAICPSVTNLMPNGSCGGCEGTAGNPPPPAFHHPVSGMEEPLRVLSSDKRISEHCGSRGREAESAPRPGCPSQGGNRHPFLRRLFRSSILNI